MSYEASTIARCINNINQSLFLPAIQRPFVWGTEDIISLFDSLMKGYPISTFLFWKLEPENKRNWVIYNFIENFRFGELHNQIASTEGRNITLVLDGQQRLTSLLIGLRGSFTSKTKNKRWSDASSWQRETLYLDLTFDPEADEAELDDDIEVSYKFHFFAKKPNTGDVGQWFRVGEMLDIDNDVSFEGLCATVLEGVKEPNLKAVAWKNLRRLYEAVWLDEVICYYTERRQDYDRALRIFIKANDSGKALSKSDILLSVIVSKWNDIPAKEEILSFVDTVNERLDRPNKLDKDLVMRACLVLSDLDHIYKIKNFTSDNLEIMRRNWADIKHSLKSTFQLANRFGLDRENTTSLNALLPVAYYIQKAKCGSLNGTAPFDGQNRERIRRWLFSALLNGVFGGNSDQTLGMARRTIANAMLETKDFPIADLYETLGRQRKRSVRLDEETVGNVMELNYGHKLAFLALSLLYEEKAWGSIAFQVDHIIPQAAANRKTLLGLNIPVSSIDRIVEASNRIGNLQILTGEENRAKSDGSFNSWIDTRDDDFLERHLIPPNRDLWDVRMLPEFVREREKLIRKKLLSVSGDVPHS